MPRHEPSSFWKSALCMIAANCCDIVVSIEAIARLIVFVMLLSNVTVPLSDSSTRERMSSSRRGFSTARGIMLVIWSSRLPAAAADAASGCFADSPAVLMAVLRLGQRGHQCPAAMVKRM